MFLVNHIYKLILENLTFFLSLLKFFFGQKKLLFLKQTLALFILKLYWLKFYFLL